MTKEEFDSLKIGDKVYCNGTEITIYGFETVHTEIVNDTGRTKHEANFIIDSNNNRRNRLTVYLKEEDKLVDLLNEFYGDTFYNRQGARQIRELLSKKLKFPTYEVYYHQVYNGNQRFIDDYNWFVEQVKKLN